MLVPVRHHSPACARMVRDTITARRPAAVLIEGPADFNDRIGELLLAHRLPIAIYSYVAWADGSRHGAYYPLCDFSPEWQALKAAQACGASVHFIDLPFAALAGEDPRTHRYGDGELRGSDYVRALCRALDVDTFDDAWDLIVEADGELTADEVMRRVGYLCRPLREACGGAVRAYNHRRERFMAAHVGSAYAQFGRDGVVVVTGGAHASGIEALLSSDEIPIDTEITWPDGIAERGIGLAPYSYERLDSLTGYDAGMPSPGFYHEAFRSGGGAVHTLLMAAVVRGLRELKQTASTADLISVEVTAQALAALRGHRRVWRRDLTDAITAALVKDDVHITHPFVRAMQEVMRGGERGLVAPETPLPPLVRDIERRLAATGLTTPVVHTLAMPTSAPLGLVAAGLMPREPYVERTLALPTSLATSRLLHQLRVLDVPGFDRIAGVDFAWRDDLSSLTETWRIQWTPDQHAMMIEASRYGSALTEAAAARLEEAARGIDRNAGAVAVLLLDAVLAGVMPIARTLRARAAEVIHRDRDLGSVARAMDQLLYLFAWDDVLGARGSAETGALLKDVFDRAVWLLESGSAAGTSASEINTVRLMRDVFERAEAPMQLDRQVFAAVLARVQADADLSPARRGACAGALWTLGSANRDNIRGDLLLFSAPDRLGDYLTGLVALTREEVQRDHELLSVIHGVVSAWDDDGFLTALPSLRLAFMDFTAREKVYLAHSMFGVAGATAACESSDRAARTADAAQAMAFEAMLLKIAAQYGVTIHAGAK